MLVKFLREEKVLDGSGKVRQHFREGEVVDLPTASARHWLNREAVVKVNASVPQFPPKVAPVVMPGPVAAEKREPDPFAAFRQTQKVEPKPAEPVKAMPDPKEEPVKRKPGRPKKATDGSSPALGKAKPSASSAAAPASPASKSITSDGDAGSSPSTTPISSHRGPMSSTPATQAGGESTVTPPDSED